MEYKLLTSSNKDINRLIEYKKRTIYEYAKDLSNEEIDKINKYVTSEVPKLINDYCNITVDNKIVGTIQAKFDGENIHIGLFAVDTKSQASGIGKKLLEFAENSSSKLWQKSTFLIEVISTRTELMQYYIRRGYQNTNSFIEFPKSEHWTPNTNEELKLLVLKKTI